MEENICLLDGLYLLDGIVVNVSFKFDMCKIKLIYFYDKIIGRGNGILIIKCKIVVVILDILLIYVVGFCRMIIVNGFGIVGFNVYWDELK